MGKKPIVSKKQCMYVYQEKLPKTTCAGLPIYHLPPSIIISHIYLLYNYHTIITSHVSSHVKLVRFRESMGQA